MEITVHRHDSRSLCRHDADSRTDAPMKSSSSMECSNPTLKGHFTAEIGGEGAIDGDETSAGKMFYLIHLPKEGVRSKELVQLVESMPSQARLAVCFKIGQVSTLRKIHSLILARRHLAVTAASFRKLGLRNEGDYGVYPEIAHPTFVFPLVASASRYAESHLMVKNDRKLMAVARKILTWIFGVNVSLAAVISVGRKP